MIIINDRDFKLPNRTVVTFGKFDGIHRGHKKLIDKAKELAAQDNLKVVLFTFQVMPGFKYGYMENDLITTSAERRVMFERLGVDILVEYPFDDVTADTEPLDFIESIIKGMLNAKYVVVGTDWTFGKNRRGNCDVLKASQKLFDFTAVVIDKELYQGREISSTWVREEIRNGCMENVNILLGNPYTVIGKVEHGKKIGRTIGFPTINVIPSQDKILPPKGVYASKVIFKNKTYYGVTNIGVKPTVTDEGIVSVETNIIDFAEDVYDENIEIMFYHFQRPEMKFDSIEKLSAQLQNDIEFTKSYFMI